MPDPYGKAPSNPFNVTKATDFTDQQIQDTWVDLGAEGGYAQVIDPTISMPRVLLGGKGTGRTHLMRFLSAPLQELRHKNSAAGLINDGYLGIYLRCSGLNAGRFEGKGVDPEVWAAIFAYSMDLWLGRLAIDVAHETFQSIEGYSAVESAIVKEIVAEFDELPGQAPESMHGLAEALQSIQSELDFAVNNAALQRTLNDAVIRIGRGRLPFAVPAAFAAHIPMLKSLNWLYLLDELENLTEDQQRYVQTLLRERKEPASFIVGARSYGFRTRMTLSADEENKEGSEYSAVRLDRLYLENPTTFTDFCRNIVARRIIQAGYSPEPNGPLAAGLDDYFETTASLDAFRDGEVGFVNRDPEQERKYLAALRSQLVRHTSIGNERTTCIIDALRIPDHPLLERLNVLLFYQQWYRGAELVPAALQVGDESREFLGAGAHTPQSPYKRRLQHHGADVLAKLLQEYSQKQRYEGLDTFVRMAGGLPRNLLIILKHVVRAAQFNAERPFEGKPISGKSQRTGVLVAADWFRTDAKAMGSAGVEADRAVGRLADLLRALRFSDKPPEVSLTTVSFDLDSVGETGWRSLKTAEDWSLLLRIPAGQKDKNTAGVKAKFQLNPMLCPLWDLPLARRGTLDLKSSEVDAIFGDPDVSAFEELRRERVTRATVPFGKNEPATSQDSLLG